MAHFQCRRLAAARSIYVINGTEKEKKIIHSHSKDNTAELQCVVHFYDNSDRQQQTESQWSGDDNATHAIKSSNICSIFHFFAAFFSAHHVDEVSVQYCQLIWIAQHQLWIIE